MGNILLASLRRVEYLAVEVIKKQAMQDCRSVILTSWLDRGDACSESEVLHPLRVNPHPDCCADTLQADHLAWKAALPLSQTVSALTVMAEILGTLRPLPRAVAGSAFGSGCEAGWRKAWASELYEKI